MHWTNKNKTFTVRTVNMTGSDGSGVMFRFLLCIDLWINGVKNDKTICFGLSWFCWGIEFWFGKELDLPE